MKIVKDKQHLAEQRGLVVNDELKNQFGVLPLFPKKIEKAISVMTMVRNRRKNIK